MGTKSIKLDKTKENNKQFQDKSKKDSSKIIQKYKENSLLNIPNPIFKNNKIVSDSSCLYFEVYKLKNINNAFYLAFFTEKKGIIIYKYLYEKKIFNKISSIKINASIFNEIKIKYFYNPLNNKEYLFIVKSFDDIEIYLIKNEAKFELIKKEETFLNQFEKDLRYSVHDISDIALFEIIYNQYDKNIYVITSVYFGEETGYELASPHYISNNIIIYIFKNDKLELIKGFSFIMSDPKDIMNIIYEDKYSKKYYIINIRDDTIYLIEIKQNYDNYQIQNLIESENDLFKLKDFFENKNNFKGCIINEKNNNDYLYLIENKKIIYYKNLSNSLERNLIIIDLFNRKVLKNIELNIKVNSIINWNNRNIIITSNKSFYIFDTRTNKLISKYSNNSGESKNIGLIKPFYDIKQRFYGLFILNGFILNFFMIIYI